MTTAAVAVLLAGGAIAAVSATGQSNGAGRHGARVRGHAHVIAAAAPYLGVSPAELAAELRSGRSLAQIADATAGRSERGLIAALVAAERSAPRATAARAGLTAEQLAHREQRLRRRAKRLVQRQLAGPSGS